MKNWRIAAIALLVLLLSLIPYGIAARSGSPDFVFSGFLINPIDGNSYLAKMVQGWSGSWKFTLPYSAQPGAGAYLFIFYLFLGHLAHWTGLSLLAVFHGARALAIIAMLGALWGFFRGLFPSQAQATIAFLVAALGSGLGWLAYPLAGLFTSDFWVPEAYPFLSAYANPHFPLSLALVLWILTGNQENAKWWLHVLRALAGLILATLLPFGVVIVGVVLGSMSAWQWFDSHHLDWKNWVFPLAGAAPVMLYQFWLTQTNPILAGWNAQNVTASPSPIDLLISLSPALVLAIIGVVVLVKQGGRTCRILIVWLVTSLVLLYLPFSMQRRFMLGLLIPVAGLAVWGLDWVARANLRKFNFYGFILASASLPTILFIIFGGIQNIQTHDPSLFLTKGEVQAMDWIQGHTEPNALILASPDTGLYLPAHTGRRVIYGHPMETVNAEENLAFVDNFFKNGLPIGEISTSLAKRGVDYLFYGPREKKLGPPTDFQAFPVVYQNSDVTIYATSSR